MPLRVVDVADSIVTGTSSPAEAVPAKFTVVLRRVRPRRSSGLLRLRPPPTTPPPPPPPPLAVALCASAAPGAPQPLDPLALHVLRDLVRHRGGLRALP